MSWTLSAALDSWSKVYGHDLDTIFTPVARPVVARIDAGAESSPDVVKWIADRFGGKPPPSTC
jgi:hypothetical protein